MCTYYLLPTTYTTDMNMEYPCSYHILYTRCVPTYTEAIYRIVNCPNILALHITGEYEFIGGSAITDIHKLTVHIIEIIANNNE